jgi:hypothetical protein
MSGADAPSGGKKPFGVIFLTILILTLSGAVSMLTIRGGPKDPWLQGAKSPYGYMTSMALFVIPVLFLIVWLEANKKKFAFYRKAFWLTCAVVLLLATALDVFLGNTFFLWQNPASYVGLYIPGFNFGGGWTWNIPIEELVFYFTGIVFMLLSYIWASTSWVSAYTCSDEVYARVAHDEKRLVLFHPGPVIAGLAVFLLALVYKKLGPYPDPGGFPGYLLFLDMLVVVPSAMFYKTVGRFINLQAFLLVTLLIMMISLLWEGTLGLAYGWWNYQHRQMLGIFIVPWYNLPIEEIVTWTAAGWMNVTILELISIYLHGDRKLLHLTLGVGDPHGR